MRTAYFDCFIGAGGDMIVGSLLDAGCDFEALRAELARLPLPGYELSVERVHRGGIAGTKFNVQVAHEGHPHRHLDQILGMIDAAALAPRATERAKKVFRRLGEAEAKVHNLPMDHIHFHEVGAVDSILDIVGSCVAMELLHIDRVLCSPLPGGHGTVSTEHGLLPVPAPATAQLLVGARTAGDDLAGEVLTPTAAALFTTLSESFGPMPPMSLASVGYGAGTKSHATMPSLLRVFLGSEDDHGDTDSVMELSANIDDCSGEILGAVIEKLLSGGCLDAWASPIVMKKSRPAWMLSALCYAGDAAAAERIIFTETTTFGVRSNLRGRTKLQRRHQTVQTPYGPVRVKLGQDGEQVLTASPEFSDCQTAAACHHVSIREVMAAALQAYRTGGPS